MNNHDIHGINPWLGGVSVLVFEFYKGLEMNSLLSINWSVMKNVFVGITIESIVETSVHALIGCAIGYLFKLCVNKIMKIWKK